MAEEGTTTSESDFTSGIPDEFKIARAKAETTKFEAEATKAVQEAAKARAEAGMVDLALTQQKILHDKVLATDEYNHVYTFDEPVTHKSVKTCMEQLSAWSRLKPGCAIEIRFSSPGGSVIDGMALWDFLNGLKVGALGRQSHHITTVALGMAASMAGILLQAGDKRVMGRESYLLIHEISTMVSGKFGEIEDEVAFMKKIQDRVLRIFASRSNMTKAQIERKWKKTDWWLSSDEALEAGFIDDVQ